MITEPPSGIGTSELGIIPFGTAANQSATSLPQNLPIARTFDANDDYAVKENKSFAQTNWVNQAVLIALATTQGTMSCNSSFGNKVPTIEYIDDKFEQNLQTYVQDALKHLTVKIITIDTIVVDSINNGTVQYTVTYNNNITKKLEEVSI